VNLTPFIPLSLTRRGGRFLVKRGFAPLKLPVFEVSPLSPPHFKGGGWEKI